MNRFGFCKQEGPVFRIRDLNSPWRSVLHLGQRQMVGKSYQWEDDPETSTFSFLEKGRVRLLNLSETGKERIVLYIEPGCLFREIVLLHVSPSHPASLVGAVFVYTPGDIAATSVFGFDGKPTSVSTWIIYGVIFLYYLIATVFPIDAIIGRIYPIFGVRSLGIDHQLLVERVLVKAGSSSEKPCPFLPAPRELRCHLLRHLCI